MGSTFGWENGKKMTGNGNWTDSGFVIRSGGFPILNIGGINDLNAIE